MNTATAQGTFNNTTVASMSEANYFGQEAITSIALEKLISTDGGLTFEPAPTPPGPTLPEGTNPVFQFIITNTGNTPLNNITLVDSVLGPITLPITTLPPGGSTTVTVTGTFAFGQHTNTATAEGTFGTTIVAAIVQANFVGEAVVVPCESVVHEAVCVQANVTITPLVALAGEVLTFCIDGPAIGPCPGAAVAACSFTVSQSICVQVPLLFSAAAVATPTAIVCSTPLPGGCPLA